MKKEYVIERQGKSMVLYEGLLDEAHSQGLCRVSTVIIQIPHADNKNTAIVHAEVETAKGTFSGIGDANPDNVGRPIIPHIVRMAETRAKARAMRDAVNIGMVSLEEMGGDDHEETPHRQEPRREEPSDVTPDTNGFQNSQYSAGSPQARAQQTDIPKASPYKPASANQLATATKLARLLGRHFEPTGEETSAEISEVITDLSREYNERKGSTPARRGA